MEQPQQDPERDDIVRRGRQRRHRVMLREGAVGSMALW
jgi:hypothetical protein